MRCTLQKVEFESSIRDLIAHTCDLVEDYLDELDIELTDMDTIGLVGGSSQIPLVRTMLEERFPWGDRFVQRGTPPPSLRRARACGRSSSTAECTASHCRVREPVSRAEDQPVLEPAHLPSHRNEPGEARAEAGLAHRQRAACGVPPRVGQQAGESDRC